MTASYAWCVQGWQDASDSKGTPDDLSETLSVCGPSDAPDDLLKAVLAAHGGKRADRVGDDPVTYDGITCHPVRMWDDDRETYLYGYVAYRDGGPWEQDDEVSFGPLSDYGQPSYGQTEIQYRRGGAWVTM